MGNAIIFKKTSTDCNQFFWNLGSNYQTKTSLAISVLLLVTIFCSEYYGYGLFDKKFKISNINDSFCLIKELN